MTCGRLDDHPGHWVTTRTVLGSKKRWCPGPPHVEGGSTARKGSWFNATTKVSSDGTRSKW